MQEKPADVLSRNLGDAISNYIRKNKRHYRMTLTLNADERRMLKQAAKAFKVPTAVMTRACALFGAAASMETRNQK